MIKVTLTEVMATLTLVSSYLGGKREHSAQDYERVAACQYDAPIVSLLMEDAALLIASRFPGPLLRWRYHDSELEFTIEGDCDAESLRQAMVKAVSGEVLRRWLRVTGSDYSDAISASADELTDALKIYFPALPESDSHVIKRASRRGLPPL